MTLGSSIHCDQVSVIFEGDIRAVDRVTLTAKAGKILSLVGPSGCGKTTMLRLMAGLQPPTDGSVTLQPDADGQQGQIGFVFQQPALLRWRTALQNVMLPLELLPKTASLAERKEVAMEMLRQVDLDDAADRYPHELSGGMRMRVSIARSLVTEPRVLLLDEPFAALDEMLRNQLGELLILLWQKHQFSAVMVTHNIAEAILLSHQIAVIRDGRVVDVIDNALPWPRDEGTRRLDAFGEMYALVSDRLRGNVHAQH